MSVQLDILRDALCDPGGPPVSPTTEAATGLLVTLGIDDPRWLALVDASPAATIFHHPLWARLLADTYGCRCFVAAIMDGSGAVEAGLPVVELAHRLAGRRWVSLPFTDSCPPLATGGNAGSLVDALITSRHALRLRAIGVRAELPVSADLSTTVTAVRHRLALSEDHDGVYSRFSKMHRRNIRLAERRDVRVHWGSAPADMDAFYHLHVMTRRRLGVPVQPRRFFCLLRSHVIESGLGFVLLATANGEPIAAAVFLHWNGELVYKYGASDHRFWDFRPNNLLFSEAIRWACDNGYHTLDFGRTDLADHGLREFKRGWGASEEPLVYSVIGDGPPRPGAGRLDTLLGTTIRHSPAWVCRLSGELLYRYAA